MTTDGIRAVEDKGLPSVSPSSTSKAPRRRMKKMTTTRKRLSKIRKIIAK